MMINRVKAISLFILVGLLSTYAQAQLAKLDSFRDNESSFQYKGLSIVAPKTDVGNQPYCDLKESGASSVAIIPFGFSRQGENTVRYNYANWQWWGETLEGAERSIEYAHNEGLAVMLKPQIYIPGSWPGALDLSDADWAVWEASYRTFILDFAQIAARQEVALFCIGTELDISAIKRSVFWVDLIKDVRTIYDGQLTYAANWDKFSQISFWSDLDHIGIDAYFPLLDKVNPSVKELEKAWKKHLDEIERTQSEYNKPVLFTEYGYLSVDNCAFENWNLESNRRSMAANEQAQARAFDALFKTFRTKVWWSGGFIWKWYIDEGTKERRPETDYTPQDKSSFYTIKKWYLSK